MVLNNDEPFQKKLDEESTGLSNHIAEMRNYLNQRYQELLERTNFPDFWKKHEDFWNFRAEWHQNIYSTTRDLSQILTTTCAELREDLDVDRTFVISINVERQKVKTVAENYVEPPPPGLVSSAGEYPIMTYYPLIQFGNAMLNSRQQFKLNDAEKFRLALNLIGSDGYYPLPGRSFASAPIQTLPDGRYAFIVATNYSKPKQWEKNELTILHLYGEKLSVSLLDLFQFEDLKSFVEAELDISKINNVELTPRQQEVLDLMEDGLGLKEIAKRLSISLSGVDKHLRLLREKTETSSNAELIRFNIEKRYRSKLFDYNRSNVSQ